ncbi:MAG TPA: hypothetical protein VGW38_29740, partial [Chloroflexota bacterium]|nr:hypothetical protein [Chloroflexota bacterium]
VTVRQLLYGMLLPSGNDAADVLAERVAGSKEQFVALMNTTAHILGMKNTRFANPSGLDERGHYSIARDMAVLARHAMQYRAFAEVAGERSFTLSDTREQAAREIQNLNLPLFYYPGVTGVKPGWTPGAGICQVVSVTLDGRSVIAVLLNTASEAADMTRLLDWLYGTRTAPSGERYALSKVFGKGDDGEPWTYYAATNQRVRAGFLHFLDKIGGVNVLGYPISGELREDGRVVQYFQRARLEWHPDKMGTPYEVQISLLGERMAAVRGHLPQPRVASFESWSTNRYFPETGHSVHDAFLGYFNRIGGIDVLGYPITEELRSDVDWAHTVQYFQRGRLQYHPDKAGTPNQVSASFVGEWAYTDRYKVPAKTASPQAMGTSAGTSATSPTPVSAPTTPVSTPASLPATPTPVSTLVAATHTPTTAPSAPAGDRQAVGAVSTSAVSTASSATEFGWSNSLLAPLRDLLRRVR